MVDLRGEKLHYVLCINGGTTALLGRVTGGLSFADITLTHLTRSASITDVLDFARLQTGHLTVVGDDLNVHSSLWDTYKASDTRGERGEELGHCSICHYPQR